MVKYILISFLILMIAESPSNGYAMLGPLKMQISVLDFGAKGDGITDDANSIIEALEYCTVNNKICYFPKTKASYNIGKTIRLLLNTHQSIKVLSNGATIKPISNFKNNSAYNLTLYKENIFMSIGPIIDNLTDAMYPRSEGIIVEVTGLIFDGNNKGEIIVPDTYNFNIYIGLQIIADEVNVLDCTFKNLLGYGIRIHNVTNANIKRSQFLSVGGRGATVFAQGIDKDAFGDAVYFALVKQGGRIRIENCVLKAKKISDYRSRSGITFEYSTAKYEADIKNVEIQGFAKSIHIEETSPTILRLNKIKFSDFNFGIANVLNDKSQIFFSRAYIDVGFSDKNDSGDALAFLNYQSEAKIFLSKSELNFKGPQQAYQSAVGLVKVDHTTINANSTNFFFADGNTTFYKCKFVDFGGSGISFFSQTGFKTYKILHSKLIRSSRINVLKNQLTFVSIGNTIIN